MKYITLIRSFILIFVCLLSVHAFAQINRTTYFMDKYSHRHVLNPAFTPRHGYFYIPAFGPHSLGLESNLGLSTFLFPLANSNELGTFLHPEVSKEQFLSKLHKNNTINFDNTLNILSFGFFAPGGSGFWTFDLGIKTNVGINLPYELFNFLKSGMSSRNTLYEIRDLNINFDSYAEAALGYSRDISDEWRVGGKLKLLAGAAFGQINFKKMDIHMSEDAWSVTSLAEARIGGKGLNLIKDSLGNITSFELDSNNLGVGGFGGAIDLGVVYKLGQLRFSLAVTDIGFIQYKKENVKIARAEGRVHFEGFNGLNIGDSNKIIGMDNALEGLQDDLLKMAEFKEVAPENTARFLRTTISAGVEYYIWDDKFSAGLLSTTRFGLPAVKTELTLSANLRPVNWFSISASYSFIASQFSSFGWGLNFTPKWGLNLFLGSDYTFFQVSPQFIPINNINFNFYFGMSVPLGCNYNRRKMMFNDFENVEIYSGDELIDDFSDESVNEE